MGQDNLAGMMLLIHEETLQSNHMSLVNLYLSRALQADLLYAVNL